MAWPTSNFPTSLDVITDKADNTDDAVAADVNGIYDCIEKIEAKVGADSSAVTTSLDYLLKNTSSSNPGHKHTLANGATDVTASKDELNYNDGASPGTAVASKTLVLGANKNVDTLSIADGGLKLGAGAGTAVTATAAELNVLDGITATTAELNVLDGITATTTEINTVCDGSTAKNNHTHSQVVASGDTIFNGTVTSSGIFQDLSVASIVGANIALCFLEIYASSAGSIMVKPKGYGDVDVVDHILITLRQNQFTYVTVMTDSSGVLSLGATDNSVGYTIKLIGYIK